MTCRSRVLGNGPTTRLLLASVKALWVVGLFGVQSCDDRRTEVLENEGVACVVSAETSGYVSPDSEVFVRILLQSCGSSCDVVEQVDCDVSLSGNTLSVEAAIEISSPGPGGACNSACAVIDAFCLMDDKLPAGDYVLDYAGETHEFSVPGSDSCNRDRAP